MATRLSLLGFTLSFFLNTFVGNSQGKYMNTHSKLKISLLIFLGLFLATEIGLRAIYFQVKAMSSLALVTTFRTIKTKYRLNQARKRQHDFNLPLDLYDKFWSPEGKKILAHFSTKYERYFTELADSVKRIGSKFIVLYTPSGKRWENNQAMLYSQAFFSEISSKVGAGFVDLSPVFTSYPIEAVTFMPEDGHMNRFGHDLVARKLESYIEKIDPGYRSGYVFSDRQDIFGDLTPNHNEIWEFNPRLPYRVQTNRQGLRNKAEVSFPKTRQRILVLGDSQTFGVFVDNYFTYVEILNRKFKDKEFFNAGKAGYSVPEELSLFNERARYIEPDITILQVLDNDLYGLFYFQRTNYNRKGRIFESTELENEFIEKIRSQNFK